jgi:hypothetical protein
MPSHGIDLAIQFERLSRCLLIDRCSAPRPNASPNGATVD